MASAPDPEAPEANSNGTSNSVSFPTVSGTSLACSQSLDSVPVAIRSVTDPGNGDWDIFDNAASAFTLAPPWASMPTSFRQGRSTSAPSRSSAPPADRVPSLGKETETPSFSSESAAARNLFRRTHSASLLWASQLGRAVSGTLNRHGVNLNTASVVPMQRCNICFDSVPSSMCVVPRACGRQAHSACVACMSAYMKLRIEEGRVTELYCPCAGLDDCQAKIADSEIDAWMSDAIIVGKYRRFVRMHDDASLRACPGCNELCKPERRNPLEADSPIVPEMTCSSCGSNFCYYHSNAHAVGAEACTTYEREMLRTERKALAKLNTHKCPRCGVLTEKISGCNHISCQCTCQWCWVCGKEITNVGWHYHPLKPLSCAQYNEKSAQRDHFRLVALMGFTKFLTWPSALVAAAFLFVCPIVFVMAVLAQVVPLCLTCWCCLFFCICCREMDMEDHLKIIMSIALGLTFLVVGVPFLVFCVAWCFVALPLWLLLLPFGARSEHLKILACAPVMTILASMECLAPETEEAG